MNEFKYYYYYYSSLFAGYPFVIKTAVAIIMLLLFLTAMSLIRFFFIRYKQLLEEKRKEKVDKSYREKLITLLFFTFKEVTVTKLKEDNELSEPIKNWQKRLLTNLILEIKNDKAYEIDGGVFHNINYYNFLSYSKLFDYWISELSSSNTSKAINALRMVNQIGEGVSGSAFSHSVNHHNKYLRKFARITFTRFDANNPYMYFEQGFDKNFNKFDEKRLHYILIEMNKDYPIPPLSKWIHNSDNTSYKCFLIREMGYFNQQEGIPYLIEMYKAEAELPVQCQIMETLGDLKYSPMIELVKEDFNYAHQLLQKAMIEGLRKLNSKKCLPFLNDAYNNTQFNEVKIQIVELLSEFDQDGIDILNSLSNKSKSKFEDNLFAYVLNYQWK